MDDDLLVSRARTGDLEAAGELLSLYQNEAYTAAVRLLGDPSDAEDVAQEALVRAYTRLSDLREGGNFAAWLRRIAVNLSLNALRRRGQLTFESLDRSSDGVDDMAVQDPVDDRQPTPEDQVVDNAIRDEIEQLVRKLPADQRIAVILRDMYGFDVAEIAELQGCGISAAKMRISRGRDRLRRLLVASARPTVPTRGNSADGP